MTRRFSRLTRFEEKKAYHRLLLTVFGTVSLILVLIFAGIPVLVKFSLLFSNLRSGGQTETAIDTTPLYPPHLEAPYTATNTAQIAISGFAEPGATLEIFANGNSLKKVLLGNDGQFSLPEVLLIEGENKITAIAKNSTNNTSQPSEPLTIIFKRTPPALEVNEPQGGENLSGEKKEIKVSGLTESNATVSINGRLAMVRSDGTFTYSLPLTAGENLIKIVAIDIAGNQTTIERKVTFSP